MKIKAVIFDLDGTLTVPFFDFDAIRTEMGYPKDAGPILELMERMSAAERGKAEDILRRHEDKAVAESKLNPGAKRTLQRLRKAGIPVGILTRNRRDNVMAVARKHCLSFDAVVDREDGPAKPAAFGVLELCSKFGVRPHEAMVVGDYLFDLLCARAAGAVPVLLTSHDESAEFAKHADFTVENLEQILQIIDACTSEESGKGN